VSTRSANPSIDTHQIVAAGLAATCAAFVTSRFGVAGTLLGAGITAMIITGGSALLKAYIENAAGRVRSGATKLRGRTEAGPAAPPEQAATPPGRPDLRNNFTGRMRAAVEWFRGLPTPARRPILIKALAATAVALVICLVAIWGVEKVIGNSLSCGFWGNCPYGAAPGIHVAGFDDSGAGSTLSGGDVDLGGGGNGLGGGGGVIDRVQEGVPGVPGGDAAPSSASPDAGGGEDPSSASPAPEPEPAPEEDPSSASPAAGGKNDADASAPPAAQ
jgi:hypothetical protein